MQLPDAPPDGGNPQQLALQHPDLPGEDDCHGDRFPGRGVLPQRDVIARWQVLHAFDAIVEAADPLQRPQEHVRPDLGEHEAPAEREERARDDEEDRVEERPQEQEARKD